MPSWVLVVDGDNALPVPLDEREAESLLRDLMRGRSSVMVEEMWPPPEGLVAEGPEGRYTHEIIVPFTRTAESARLRPRAAEAHNRDSFVCVSAGSLADTQPSPIAAPGAPVKRRFLPGSEWLSVKMYGTPALVDRLVQEVLPNIVQDVRASGADRWFFVRYSDPDFHVRLRFHGEPKLLTARALPRIQEILASSAFYECLCRVEVGTYVREVERYGGPACIEIVEDIFERDSDAIIEALGIRAPDGRPYPRWQIALLGFHHLLEDAEVPLLDRIRMLRAAHHAYRAERGNTSDLASFVGRRVRDHRTEALQILSSDESPFLAVFRRRSLQCRAAIRATRRVMAEASQVDLERVRFESVLGSLLHMHANRLFADRGREHELVLTKLLAATYEARMAREPRM